MINQWVRLSSGIHYAVIAQSTIIIYVKKISEQINNTMKVYDNGLSEAYIST